MLERTPKLVLLAALLLVAVPVCTAQARTISWSGHTWDVRPAGHGGPGPNAWSDSEASVRVEGGELVLSTVRGADGVWTSAEIDNQRHLGYGTYRWVVSSDLSTLDANEVVGLFTYGGPGPSNNEIDIEPSHWGSLGSPTGAATSWQDAGAGLRQSKTFNYTDKPPYVNQFTWEPGRITYLVTDATGARLLSWSVTSGVPVPSTEVPVVNYWRYDGVPPAGARSVRLASFAWAAPGREGDLPPLPAAPANDGAGGPGASAAPAAAPWRCGIAEASGTRAGGARSAGAARSARVTWTAGGPARLRLAVLRRVRGGRLVRVGTVARTLREGSGSLRFAGHIGPRRLASGRYRLELTVRTAAGLVRCGPKRLSLTVPAR